MSITGSSFFPRGIECPSARPARLSSRVIQLLSCVFCLWAFPSTIHPLAQLMRKCEYAHRIHLRPNPLAQNYQ